MHSGRWIRLCIKTFVHSFTLLYKNIIHFMVFVFKPAYNIFLSSGIYKEYFSSQFSLWLNRFFLLCVFTEMMQSLAQRPAPANTNRERRPRYQHPKGAPNADLIFKTGGRWDVSRDGCGAGAQKQNHRMCWILGLVNVSYVLTPPRWYLSKQHEKGKKWKAWEARQTREARQERQAGEKPKTCHVEQLCVSTPRPGL